MSFSGRRALRGSSLVLAVALGGLLAGLASSAGGAEAERCGHVKPEGTKYLVTARHVDCDKARSVVNYVLTHGEPTQGSPGIPPPGWSCGWSYGTHNGEPSRAGPACEKGRKRAFGYQEGWKPL